MLVEIMGDWDFVEEMGGWWKSWDLEKVEGKGGMLGGGEKG